MTNNVELHLEITNRCRLACPKCTRTILGKEMKIKDLSLQSFKKLAESKQYSRMFFCGTYGDCIYHPKFIEIIDIAKKNQTQVHIVTNGSGRSLQWWERVLCKLDSGDTINIAMDGLKNTSGIYRKNFTEQDFDKNIELLRIVKNKYNINTVWTFIPFSYNEKQIEEAANIAIENNIVFVVKKSSRWDFFRNDYFLPKNKKLISSYRYNEQ